MAAISKEEYLKRYLSGETSTEKKKKRKKVKAVKHPKSKIIDDDIDLKTIGGSTTNEQEESEDEAPTVAAVVDERPEHVKRLEEYRKDQRWKVLGQKEKDELASMDYGVITSGNKQEKGQNKRPHSQYDVDSDTSPPRRKRHDSDSDDSPPRRKQHDSDSDASPPRKKRHDSDSDTSPPRKKRHDSDSDTSPRRKKRHDSNSDASPPRKKRYDSDSDASPPRKKRHDSDSDASSPRRKPRNSDSSHQRKKRHDTDGDVASSRRKKQYDSDASPPRRKRLDSDSDASPPRKRRHDSDSDNSPARPKRQGGNLDYCSPKPEMGSDRNTSKRHERKRPSRFAPAEPQRTETSRHDSDSDQSPQRRQRHGSGSDHSPPRRQRHDSDQSPKRKQRHDSDSDQSPPRQRKRGIEGDKSPRKRDGGKDAKPEKTLGGAKAGLSSAAEMKKEAAKLRKREEDNFSKINREALGRDAATVFRDKSGKRRNLAAEKEKEEKEAQKKAVDDKKYEEWGKGLKQKELREQTMEDYVHEASKPLARYKDDQDLDRIMREMERDGDPMAMYMKKKKTKKEDTANEKPRYRGPAPPPNRFQIMPGYRWDGVDRSNGFEKQIFTKMSEKKAVKEHAYKWSTEDM